MTLLSATTLHANRFTAMTDTATPTTVQRALLLTDVLSDLAFTARYGQPEADVRIEKLNKSFAPIAVKNGGALKRTEETLCLFEFDTAFEAVSTAIQIQRAVRKYNASQPSRLPEEPVRVRAAVHYGVLRESGGEIYGEAVMFLAEFQELGEAEEILVSEPVHRMIAGGAVESVFFSLETFRGETAEVYQLLWDAALERRTKANPPSSL